MATYKMLKTQRGVRTGEVHSVVFHEGNTYEIGDELAEQFKTLEAIEPSGEKAVEAFPEDGREDLHENWLDKDPAVLRHGELTAAQVVARDESDKPDPAPVKQAEGKAEGDEPVKADDSDGKAKKTK